MMRHYKFDLHIEKIPQISDKISKKTERGNVLHKINLIYYLMNKLLSNNEQKKMLSNKSVILKYEIMI